MIKDVFDLKKDGWYTKMVKYMWNVDYYDFSHMCPFFWLCVFSVLISWAYFPIRFIAYLIVSFVEAIRKIKDQKKEEKYKKTIIKQKTDQEVAKINIQRLRVDPDYKKTFAEKFYYFRDENQCLPKEFNYIWGNLKEDERDDIEAIIAEIRKARASILEEMKKKEAARIEAERLAMIARKERINKILRWTKPISKAFLWILAGATSLFAVYLLYKGVILLTLVKRSVWLMIGKYTLWSIIFVGTVCLIVYAFRKVEFPTIDLKLSCQTKKNLAAIGKMFNRFIILPVVWLVKGIGKIFGALFMAVKNECPAIKWH